MEPVWRVDTRTRKYELAIKDDETMHFPAWEVTPFGINGLHILNGYLASVYRIAVSKHGYAAPGAHGELVKRLQAIKIDTFCLGPGDNDTIWGATDADNRLVAVTPDGTATFVAGAPDEMTLAGSVAPAFGTLPGDTDTLYVATRSPLPCGALFHTEPASVWGLPDMRMLKTACSSLRRVEE
ncbi:hypothetical protein N7519_004940 [Penicillium mononematosum]|uniref:uncharacterized protein n=1 Tax=Penicillium mononematosum TaxID=268346 RepID=UPI002546F69B|nr:uncharacterized protein N7519_004940 [Penicillium mononematosum]KAJ6183639.1 hypothetical protein N7519_004940 [Penicillium mononematosum]